MSVTDRHVRAYLTVLILCFLGLLLGLWNGFARGHWWGFGLFVVTVIGANMVVLLARTMRNEKA